jgi:hypothetical protein
VPDNGPASPTRTPVLFQQNVPTRSPVATPGSRRPAATRLARSITSPNVDRHVAAAVVVMTSVSAGTAAACRTMAGMVSGRSCMVLFIGGSIGRGIGYWHRRLWQRRAAR